MELNTSREGLEEEAGQYDTNRGAQMRDTVLDSWMNDLRKMFGKRKKPPRYERTAVVMAPSPLVIKMTQMEPFSQQPSRPAPEVPNMLSESMFGGHVGDSVDQESGVAQFVLWCVRAIEMTGEGLKTDGIYSTVGNQARVNFITQQDEVSMQKFLDEEENVFTLTGALKVFFRQLKIPLVDFQDFSRCFQAENAVNEMRLLTNSLPAPYRNTLSFLIHHLTRVLKLEIFNKTSLVELGVVFGPTLMRLSPNCQNMAGEMKQQSSIVEFLVQECDAIFPDPRDQEEKNLVPTYTETSADNQRGPGLTDNLQPGAPEVTDNIQLSAPGVTDNLQPGAPEVTDNTQLSSPGVTDNRQPGSLHDSDDGGFDSTALEARRRPHIVEDRVTPRPQPPIPNPKPSRLASADRCPENAAYCLWTDTNDSSDPPESVEANVETRGANATSKKSRSTPVDSYCQRASSDSDESEYSDYDDSQEAARSVPTAL